MLVKVEDILNLWDQGEKHVSPTESSLHKSKNNSVERQEEEWAPENEIGGPKIDSNTNGFGI